MKKIKRIVLFIFVALNVNADVAGQSINLNTENGLPAHTYCMLADHNGYLWIGTNEYVYRYNGYSIKKYDNKSGLSYKDIWALYEDSSGRMWLFNISDQLGYIYQDQFHLPYSMSGGTLYPGKVVENKGILSFISSYNSGNNALCTVAGDTLYTQNLPPSFKIGILTQGYLYAVVFSDSMVRIAYTLKGNGRLVMKESYRYFVQGIDTLLQSGQTDVFSKYWISYLYGSPFFYILDMPGSKLQTVDVGENIHSVFGYKRHLYITGDERIFAFDTFLRKSGTFSINIITGNNKVKGKDVAHFIKDPLWGKCLATKGNGIYIHSEQMWPLNIVDSAFKHFRYLGFGRNGNSYWWDNISHTLAAFEGTHLDTTGMPSLQAAASLIPYNKDSSIIVNIGEIYWLDHHSHAITRILYKGGFKGFVINGRLYIASQTSGFYSFEINNPSQSFKELDSDRYSGIEYNALTNSMWLYTGHKITIFRGDSKIAQVSGRELADIGVKSIESIRFDKFGNVYLNADGRVIMFNPATFTVRDLAEDIVTYGAIIETNGNCIVAAGRFGLMYAKVEGSCNVSNRQVIYNWKSSFYDNVEATAFTNNGLIVKTDKACYGLSSSALNRHGYPPLDFHLVASASNSSRQIKTGDTIELTQSSPQVTFDLVNPAGVGKADYKCRIIENTSDFSELVNSNLLTHDLVPDRYYHLQMLLEDDVWRSKPIQVCLYVVPYWWQKRSSQLFLLPLILISVLLVIGASALLARRTVLNINHQKNLFLELKLKAIYAQLNPHFIFNTLGIVQFFANRNDSKNAATVVEKFSQVLRSYLWSSRNKLVSVKQEIEHLENYIELQQLRFQGKFSYQIIVDEQINTQNTLIPSLLLQPLVENAINHGLFHRKKDGQLTIEFKKMKDENGLICIVDDNGVGRERAKEIEKNTQQHKESYGSDLINDLVKFFKKYERLQIDIEYKDKPEPLNGTTVIVRIFYDTANNTQLF